MLTTTGAVDFLAIQQLHTDYEAWIAQIIADPALDVDYDHLAEILDELPGLRVDYGALRDAIVLRLRREGRASPLAFRLARLASAASRPPLLWGRAR